MKWAIILLILLMGGGCAELAREVTGGAYDPGPSRAEVQRVEAAYRAEQAERETKFQRAKEEYDAERAKEKEEQKTLWAKRNAALRDGRIKVGMTFNDFADVWGTLKLLSENPRISESHFAGHQICTFDFTDWTQERYPRSIHRHVIFSFDNSILQSWHEF